MPLGAKAADSDSQDGVASITAGKQIYDQYCAACHGPNLKGPENPKDFGTRVPPRLDGEGSMAVRDDAYLTRKILQGSRDAAGRPVGDGMPPFKGVLSAKDIHDVLGYIKSRWHGAHRHMNGMGGMGGDHMR